MFFAAELFETAAHILHLTVVQVEWEQLEGMVSGAGAKYFARNAEEVVGALERASARVQTVFDRFRPPADADARPFSRGNRL